MIDMIETQAALDASCDEAAEKPWVGLDTEFERIRTYYPRLCLVQMSTPEMTICVDPLADLDFSPLHALLANPGVVKIFHAARQDLEVYCTPRLAAAQLRFLTPKLRRNFVDTESKSPMLNWSNMFAKSIYPSNILERLGVAAP